MIPTPKVASPSTAVFSIHGLSKVYPHPVEPIVALRGIDVEIGPGVTAVVGPSGQGKTTLLNVLGGMDRPTSGSVSFRGEPMRFEDPEAMRRHRASRVAWVFQDLNLIGHLTARENVALPRLLGRMPRARALALAERNLRELGVGELAHRRPGQLSRGQQQRVAIARAFASGAEVILADEPTGSLDPERSAEVMAAFRAAADAANTPVVLVTHDHSLAHRHAHRVLECAGGTLREVSRRAPESWTERVAWSSDAARVSDGFRSSGQRRGRTRARMGFSLGEGARFAASDLIHRKSSWLLMLLALLTPLVFALWLGYHAISLRRFKAAELARTVPERLTAICPDPADLGRRWSGANLDRVNGWPAVAAAYPRIESSLRLSTQPDAPVLVTAEGIRADDPCWNQELLAWGRFPTDRGPGDEVVLGSALFGRLGGQLTSRGPEPAVLTATLGRTVDGRPEIETLRLRVAGLLRNQPSDRVFVPLAVAERLDLWCLSKITALGEQGGPARSMSRKAWALVAGDRAEEARAEAGALRIRLGRGESISVTRADMPIRVEVEGGDSQSIARAIGELAGVDARPVRRLEIDLDGHVAVIDAWETNDPRWAGLTGGDAPGFATLVAADPSAVRLELRVAGRVLRVLRGQSLLQGPAHFVTTPRTLAWITFTHRRPEFIRWLGVAAGWLQPLADRLAFAVAEARGALAPAGRALSALSIDDPLTHVSARRRCVAAGLRWRTVSNVGESVVTLHEFTDVDRKDGLVDERLVVIVSMSRPSFLAAGPLASEEGWIDGEPTALEGSQADDPRRFRAPLLSGRWLSRGGRAEVVLPRALAGKQGGAGVIGRTVMARFERGGDALVGSALEVPLRVVGVVEDGAARVASELLGQVEGWRRRELVFDRARGRFEPPRIAHERNGHLRATVVVRDAEDVSTVVDRLERMGYLTQNSLEQQAGLRRLTWALWGMVLLLVLGGVITAGINVGSTTALNLQAKSWEIAVLHALGATRRDVLGVFATQAVALAFGAFALASAIVILAEPATRPILRDTLALPLDAIASRPILAPEFAWLFAATAGAALVLCLVGTLVPASLAVGASPARALRNRG